MIETILRSHLIPQEKYTYGFADLTGLLTSNFYGFNYGISIGLKLSYAIVDRIKDGPTQEYYDHYKKVNKDLHELTKKISLDLNNINIKTINIEPSVSTADLDTKYFDTLKTEISHKMVATRAGLGWIGKTDLFISKEAGPRLRLASILLNQKVTPKSQPVNKSRCGTCKICVEICPAKAANGLLWDISIKREKFFDAWKCYKKCTEFGRLMLNPEARVCGMCVSVCPIR